LTSSQVLQFLAAVALLVADDFHGIGCASSLLRTLPTDGERTVPQGWNFEI